ncbi:MAG: PilZ domain-containing protein [Candidatus Omnitrophica bacterium]|nr:PilZ domain-containing protein [Candidatus Omnitrophota bacterium]
MDERRSCVRWQINQEAELKLNDSIGVMPCTVDDISLKGIRISLRRNLFPEVLSRLNLALPNGPELRVEARVAWQDNSDLTNNVYGMSFVDMKESNRKNIYDYVSSNFPQEVNRRWKEGLV